MPQARPPAFCLPSIAARGGLLLLACWVASCASNKIAGVPEKLPEIALAGSTATPAHGLAGYEYPFDPNGNYIGDWAAEGERRSGRSARATDDDEKKWSGSHGGRSGGASRSKKSSASKTVSKPSDDNKTPSKKSPSSSTAKTKSGGGKKYVVKKGDTVERIARRNGISVSKLKSANGLKSDLIRDGQSLTIPN